MPCRLDQSVAHRISHTAAKLERFVNRFDFEPMGLTFSSALILFFIIEKGTASPTGIREFLGVTKSNVTQRLNALETKGFIERIRTDGDRRAQGVRLTAEGEAKSREVDRILMSRGEELDRLLGKGEVELMNGLLTKIDAILDTQSKLII